MIAALIPERCDNCRACVLACPGLVFDDGARHPVVARLDACETCYLCELACTRDALWVAPEADSGLAPPQAELIASGQLGQIRRDHGWNQPLDGGQLDAYRLLGPLLHEGSEIAARRHGGLAPGTGARANSTESRLGEEQACPSPLPPQNFTPTRA